MASVWAELKRRNVVKVAVAYAVVAWLLIEIASTVFPLLQLPEWTATFVAVLLIMGFPVALILSWAYELTPEGMKRSHEVEAAESTTHLTGRKIDFAIIGALVLALAFVVYNYVLENGSEVAGVLSNSVAVLPFDNLSPNPDNAYYAAGIHEAILDRLAKIGDLNVISRTSVLQYAKGVKSVQEIAEELNVETVMEGSVRYSGNRMRIAAQLIDPITGAHLWSDTYEHEFDDIFSVESDIAMNVANALAIQFSLEEQASIERVPTASLDAYARVLQLVNLLPPNSLERIRRMIEFAEEAIELDQSYADAWGHRALLYTDLANRVEERENRAELEQVARDSAERALQLDPNLHSGHRALGRLAVFQIRWAEAREHYERGVSSSNTPPNATTELVRLYSLLGEHQDAIILARRNLDLNPNHVGARIGLIDSLLDADRIQEAIVICREIIESNPGEYYWYVLLGFAQLASGQTAEALRALELAAQLYTEADPATDALLIGYAFSRAGALEDAQRMIEVYTERDIEAAPEDELYISLIEGDNEQTVRTLPNVIQVGAGSWTLREWKFFARSDPSLQIPLVEELYTNLGL